MPRKEPGFAERLQTAVKSKQAQLEKIRAATQASDPQPAEAPSDQAKAAAERKARNAERKEAERIARAQAEAALKVDQKAARDAKYAARKARQK